VGGVGGARGQHRAGHAYTKRVVDHRGHLLSPVRMPAFSQQQNACFEGRW
jgi:hypothetical protein